MSRDTDWGYTREDAEQLAQALLELWAGEHRYQSVATIDILDTISLDALASSVAGITDPIGQLKDWLYDVLKKFVDYIVSAVQGIVSTFYENIIRPALDAIANVLSYLAGKLSDWFSSIQSYLSTLKDMISNIVVKPLQDLVDWVQQHLPWLYSIVQDIASALTGLVDRLRSAVEGLADRLRGLASTVADAVSSAVSAAASAAASIVDAVRSRLVGLVTAVVDAVRSRVESLVDALTGIASSIADRLRGLVGTLAAAIDSVRQRISGILDTLRTAIDSLLDRLRGAVSSIIGAIGRVPDIVTDILGRVAEAARSVIDTLESTARRAAETLTNIITRPFKLIQGMVNDVLKTLGDVKDYLSKLADNLKNLPDAVKDLLSRLSAAKDIILGAVNEVVDNLSKIGDALRDALARALKAVEEAVTGLVDRLRSAVSSVVDALVDTARRLPSMITDAVSRLRSALEGVFRTVTGGVTSLIDKIRDILDAVNELLSPTNVSTEFIEYLRKAAPDVYNELENVLRSIHTPVDAVRNLPRIMYLVLLGAAKIAWYVMPNEVRDYFNRLTDAVRAVGNALTGFVNAILKFPEWFPNWFREHIAEPIKDAIEGLAKAIWDHMPDAVKSALTAVADALKWMGEQVAEFMKDPRGKIMELTNWLYEKLLAAKELLMRGLGYIWEGLKYVAEKAWDVIKTVAGYVAKGIAIVGEYMVKALFGAIELMYKAAMMVKDGIAAVLRHLVPPPLRSPPDDEMRKLFQAKLNLDLYAVMWPLTLPLQGLRWLYGQLSTLMPSIMRDPVSFMYGMANLMIFGTAMTMILSHTYKALASVLGDISISLDAFLRPLGVGGKVGGKAKINLSKALEQLAKTFDNIMPDVFRYIMIGHMIWWAEPTRSITRYWLTSYLTIELPPMEQTLKSLRRHIATPVAQKYYRIYVDQLRMGGISQAFIDYLYPLPEKLMELYQGISPVYDDKLKAIIITDRFGQPRVFPVTLVAEIPTPSELARMMIRDIILNPKDFAAAMAMHGFTPDTAFMFYLLHFRYPSPEKLSDFFWRGVAGELWNPDESYDESIAKLFFKEGQPPKPIAPRKLNFAADHLFEMMKQYMKWHDYARIPWRDSWPTDNAIIMDLIADIPGKIDLRWMTRWGVFDYWGAYGVTTTTTIEEITKGLLKEGQAASAEPMYKLYLEYLSSGKVVFDVRQFARALQATGLHPYWVPWVTVAETINALAEERTLLRTGFMNLFREGLWPLDTLNKLLAGFFTVVFKTAYFDPEKLQWRSVDIEYPVAFLPAESKLLELRAVMDKALDIYREAYRRVIRAVMLYSLTVEEAKTALSNIVAAINKMFFADEIKRITGKDLALEMDEGYWGAWSIYATIMQDVEAVERTRYYARYIIWSVLYALLYGYVTRKDAEEWVENLVNTMHEHPRIRQMIQLSVDFMVMRAEREQAVRAVINQLRSRRITLEEAVKQLTEMGFSEDEAKRLIMANVYWYTPSIGTYASMLEVVPEALDTVLSIVAHLGLPRDEYKYWVLYLLRQPVRDELTLVRTRIYQLISLGVPADEIVSMLSSYAVGYTVEKDKIKKVVGPAAKKLLDYYDENASVFQAYGISPHEWVLYNLIGQMDMKKAIVRGELKERIPSPSTLATLAEYLVLPEDLVKKTLMEYHVAPEWLPYWLEYIRVKPLKSDYKSLLGTYIRALRYGAVTREEFSKFLEELKNWGFTPVEISVIERRAALEEAIVQAREAARLYIPTPTMLATLSEYLVLPENLIQEVFKRRHVPEEWQRIWLEYIRVRPFKSDYRRLLTAYIRGLRYGVITRSDVDKLVNELRNWGFTPKEIEIIERLVDVEEAIAEAREYIPTPSQLATIAEYVPAARKLAAVVLQRRRVPREWWSIWLQYIHVRPLASEVREIIRDIRSLYEYFAIKYDDLKRLLKRFIVYGLEDEELALLLYGSQLRAALRAYRELVGTPRQLVTMAEYSPRARRLALAQVYKMIDALPVDQQTKEFLKKMWEEYIRVRPVYDEVRRYVTELISDYANGLMTDQELKQELEALKDWGLDDYEIQFYMWLAQRRRVRYVVREMMRQGYFGL